MSIIWANDFSGGTNQSTPGLSANNESDLLVDTSQAQLGNIAHRLGDDLYLDSKSASVPVRGLHMYKKQDGTNYLHMVQAGTLWINGVSSWTSQDASEWNTASEINMVNFTNRHYMASSTAGEYLKYATESGSVTTPVVWTTTASSSSTGSTLVINTNQFSEFMVGWTINNTTDGTTRTITGYTNSTTVTVSSAINDTWDGDTLTVSLDGKYLAVNGAYMMLAGNSTFPRRTFYSNVDNGLFSVETDFFITSEPPTGVASFGNGRTFIIFTKSGYMVADPAQPNYTTEVEGFGCVSHRSIQVVKGGMVYLGNDAFYYIPTNASVPLDVSRKIQNDLTMDAIFNRIDKGKLSVTASGTLGDIYWCSVRDLTSTVKGETLEDVLVVIDLAQNSLKVESHTTSEIGNVFAQFTDSTGETNLYAGSYITGTVYRVATPGLYTDDNRSGTPSTVTAKLLTKHFEFINKTTGVSNQLQVDKLWFKYRSASIVSVGYALDGETTYTTLENLPIYTDTQWSYNYIDLGVPCRTISLKLTFTGECIIYGIGFEGNFQKGEGIKGL